ncbi:MAG TPA: VOC family protein [Pyrinomonadaceae bacterium]|nr:VOC family protein [Pyrinomonadaceae bacterium]
MARPSKLAHVVYMTRRYEEMLEWYKTVFEASAQYENPAFAFLTYDDEHHRFAFANMSMLDPDGEDRSMPHGVGVNHVGYTFADAGELLDTYDRLKQAGIKPYWSVHHGVTLSCYYQDPDGNRMEFQVDCFKGAVEANAFMQSEAFAANPIGVDVDFEILLDRYRSGVSVESLMTQPEGPMSALPAEHGMSPSAAAPE